jgi:predicted amidophosphoribosyltransferase
MSGRKLAKCKDCGRPFLKVRQPFCVECLGKQDDQFGTVADYLRDNPQSDVAVASRETGVPASTILSFLRGGRLDVASFDPSSVKLNCQGCGKEIGSGTHCESCSKRIAESMATVGTGKSSQGSSRPIRGVAGSERKPVTGEGADAQGSVKTGFFSYGKKKQEPAPKGDRLADDDER